MMYFILFSPKKGKKYSGSINEQRTCLWGLLKKAASGVLIARKTQRTVSVRLVLLRGLRPSRGNGASWRAGVGRVRKRLF